MSYIITAEPKEAFNYKGESWGMEDKRALFYSTGVSRTRIYRQSFDCPDKKMKLKSFKKKQNAEKLCNRINEVNNDNFKVESL